jgi:hypothetical protein
MFKWLKTRLIAWFERYQRWEIKRLYEERRRMKKEMLKLAGGERIPLSSEQRRLLPKKASGIDPKVLNRISVLDPSAASERHIEGISVAPPLATGDTTSSSCS